MLKLPILQTLTEYVYTRYADQLIDLLDLLGIEDYIIIPVLKNDRALIFHIDNYLYCIIAGSDDKRDWIENLSPRYLKQMPKLMHSYKGVGEPAESIMYSIMRYCKKYSLRFREVHIRVAGHSRGSNIAEVATALIERFRGSQNIKGYGFGGTGAGGKKFQKASRTDNFFRFVIKGDFAKWINPIDKCSGEIIPLPKQRKGFFKRLGGLFKGKMNHREYSCISDISPYNSWS